MKNDDENFIIYFYICYDVHPPRKKKIKTPVVCGESKKKKKCINGKFNLMA